MAKFKHNNFLDTVNEVFSDAKQEGVMHLYAEGGTFTGRTIGVKGKKLFHFGTTGYLGLEQDSRLKAAAIDAIKRYGTQFPLSKSYISNPLYNRLEEKLTEMYQNPIIITKNSTLGHMGVIPNAVNDQDAIILDHQVHWSVQSAAKVLKNRSVPIDMIRHNDLNMLEDKLKLLANKRNKIWYMADGIYSMYGDFAPIQDLKSLSLKYPQLHLYIDDVHGMSWTGKNGTGYALSVLKELSENVLLFGTLSKTFGASGAVLVCSNKKMYQEIKTFGGPLTFSAQLEPASVAAATASADIHLSSEIYELQDDLRQRIQYFNSLLKQTDLPLIDQNNSPVFFIGTGMPKTGYNFVNRLMSEGYYVNLGIFPAVPVKNTGVRITISRHNEKEEIKGLVEAMVYHYPKALEDTYTDLFRVKKAFKLNTTLETMKPVKNLKIQLEDSILKVDKQLWNTYVGNHGVFDWEGLKFQESVFNGNTFKEHNWIFKYIIISDEENRPIIITYLTIALWKDDMLAKVSASKIIEEERKTNPYYLTSKVLSLGSLFTEGNHLYIDDKNPYKQQALDAFIQLVEQLELSCKATMTVLRDFPKQEPLHAYFQGQGFVRVQMPNACEINLGAYKTIEDYCSKLSSRNRKHLRKEILGIEPELHIEVCEQARKQQLQKMEVLFKKVHQNNLGLNTFSFPQVLFEAMAVHPNWEFITISPKNNPSKMIGVMFCYKNGNHSYVPAFIGMDYSNLDKYYTYRQLLYQTIKRAICLNFKYINMGMTASFEKRKLGAVVEEKYAYIQTSDNYTLELMGILE
ncbi:aminotransferase class I/II-fold pyridoxal phosphate-dependent enzyme [Cellulophaga sp. F20128]|uniref:aminotransferase class I/II-fold pyridoxal phosphate-dependent enzyme n=1 Tax=Cellulophaga sp. F20128 TaxID=2926413 RepID=UPI001FF6F7B3|nr:aminotransferase class I/II-fold pyridoxal phosphate-dependent enzyme [Cellulophaga sp. F20128]MCK0156355.1 aminotransferase class I/II-fold pyridoxal phosphate-dependent enzyme [Cellulophaga sp. F20128]